MRSILTYNPKIGGVRYVTKFLWIPKEIGLERRWLERATWKEIHDGIKRGKQYRWRPIRFVDGLPEFERNCEQQTVADSYYD